MMLIRLSASFLVFQFLFICQAQAHFRCTEAHERQASADAPTPDVQLVWYPNSRSIIFSHLELAVDGTLWASNLTLTREGGLENRKVASRLGGRGFLVFHLRVGAEQYQNLQKDLTEAEGRMRLHTCSSGACNFLRKSAGLTIPFPFSLSPTMTATYVSILRAVGSKKIDRIEWVGPRNWRQFLTTQPAAEIAATVGVYKGFEYSFGFLVTMIDKLGHPARLIVPVIAY